MNIEKWCIILILSVILCSPLVVPVLAERIGTKLPARTMISGTPSNEQELVSALLTPDSIQYVDNLTFHGASAQLGVLSYSLQGFPVAGAQYLGVSTGTVADIAGQAPTFVSTDVDGVDIPGGSPDGLNGYDVATLSIRLDLTGVSASDNPKLVFYFKFMSEEVPTFVGSEFQDFFTVHVYNASGTFVENIARLPDGSPFTIDNAWPLMNQVEGSSGNPLPPYPDPNDVVFNGCTDVRPVEFGLSGLAGQVCTIEFQIGDVSDEIYDSAVFLDGLHVDLEGGGGDEDRVDLGLVVVYGDNVFEFEPNRFRVQGNVHINDVMRFDGNLEVNTLTKTVTGNCMVWFEDPDKSGKFTMPEIDISDVAVQFFIDASQDPAVFRFSSQISELGFEVAGVTVLARELELYFNHPQHGYGLSADVYLAVGNITADPEESGPGGALFVDGLYATSLEGIWFDQAKIIIENASLPGGFALDYMEMTYEPGPQKFAVDNITVSIKHWDVTVWGNFTILGGQIEAFGLRFEHGTGLVMIPLPSPPSALYLQSLDAGIEGLATGDVKANGGIGFTYMPELEVAGYTCHVVRCDVTGLIEEGHFNVTGVVSLLFDGWENAGITVDWQAAQGVTVDGLINLADIITGTMHATINDHFRCTSSLSAQMPCGVPIIGSALCLLPPVGVEVVWEDWTIGFQVDVLWSPHSVLITADPNCPYTQSCGWWQCFGVPFTPVTICVDCGFDHLLDKTYSQAEALGPMRAKAALVETFWVKAGQAFALARVEGEDGTVPYFELIDPLGNVITPVLAAADPDDYIYQANASIGEAWIAVRNPMAGQWTIQVPGTLKNEATARNGLAIQALSAPLAPTIEIIEPATPTTTSDQVQIGWQGTSSTPTTDVSLFYSDTEGEAGALIADGLPVSGNYDWDVRGTPPGTYWVYGTIGDGKNAAVIDFGPATVTIEKDDPVAVLYGPETVPVGLQVTLDATGSSDPWQSDLTYEWGFLNMPEGSAAGLWVQDSPDRATFAPDLPGTFEIRVLVTDPFGAQDFAQITVQAVSSPAALSVPQVGTISFVGSDFTLVATVTDHAASPIANEMVYFDVISGPHVGTGTAVATNLAGKAAFTYTGGSVGTDTIQVWAVANTFEEALPHLRAEIGHVWTKGADTAAIFRVESTGDVLADGSYYGETFETGAADVAEWVSVSEPVESGDVLELDPDNPGHYRKSRGSCSTLVAGVVSTNPGFVLGSRPPTPDSGLMTDDSRLPTLDSRLATPDSALLALVGIVPIKVTDEGGPIQPGDLLTTSSTPGYAMKWNQEDGLACGLLGKALEQLDSGTGLIEALLMR